MGRCAAPVATNSVAGTDAARSTGQACVAKSR